MWFSKVTSLGAVCNTTTSFDDEPCDHQKEGWCPRVVESDRDVTCSEHFGGTGKKRFTCGKQKTPKRIWGFLFSPYISTVVTGVFKVVVSAGYLEKMSLTIFENEENQGMLENIFQWLKVRLYQYV